MLNTLLNVDLFSVIFNSLLVILEVFMITRVIVVLVNFLSFIQKKRMWSTILMLFFDFYMLYTYALQPVFDELIHSGRQYTTDTIIFCVINFIGIIVILFQTLTYMYQGFRFKSRRQRQFERTFNGKDFNFTLPLIISIIVFIASFAAAVYYQIYYTSSYKTELKVSRALTVIFGLAIVYIVTSIILQNKNKKHKDEKVVPVKQTFNAPSRDFVFILEAGDETKIYKAEVSGRVDLHTLLGTIVDNYYVSSYGTLTKNGKGYILYGVKTSSFEPEFYDEIKMNEFDSEEIKAIIPYLEKNQNKNFNLDEFNNPKDSFDA